MWKGWRVGKAWRVESREGVRVERREGVESSERVEDRE